MNVVLFHSIYGLRPGVVTAAEIIRQAGHSVATPDLYDGRVAAEMEEGQAIRKEIGVEKLMERAAAAVADVAAGTVYGGFSMGAGVADYLTRQDPRAAGLLLFGATGDYEAEQKLSCPWQIHVADNDPWCTAEELAEWSAAEPGGEVFVYPRGGHLYLDPGLPDYDAASAEQTWPRVLEFLDRLSGR